MARRPLALALSVAITICCWLGCAVTASAASSWGELEHAFVQSDVKPSNRGSLPFAVDPSDGSFYVADEVQSGAKPTFRIQRFDFNGKGEATPKASIEFSVLGAGESKTESGPEEIQLAVDPTRHRVYALVVYKRREINESEEKQLESEEEKIIKEGKKCEEKAKPPTCYERFPLDSEELAAGEIFAFHDTGGSLVSAATVEGTGAPAPVVSENSFKPQGEKPTETLLNPRGLAVEPATGDVVIVGQQDEQEDLKVEQGSSRECHAVAQTLTVVEKSGELTALKLGGRFVDGGRVLQELHCEAEAIESIPYSPAVTANGRLLALETRSQCPEEAGEQPCAEDELWELGESSESFKLESGATETPNKIALTQLKPTRLYAIEPEVEQQLLRFGAEGTVGPLMSYVSDSSSAGSETGKVYLSGAADINNSVGLVLGYAEAAGKEPTVAETGWSGGGQESAGEECVIPKPGSQAFALGGFRQEGGHEGFVAFDTFTPVGGKETIEASQFGPGGSTVGCPTVTVSRPSMTVGGLAVQPLPGEVATFSSTVTGANVESVEWKFENKETHSTEIETDPDYEFQATTLEHEFAEEGAYKVTEIVQTDDLAEPSVTAQTLEVTVKPGHPLFQIVGPEKIKVGQEASFEAEVSDGNKKVTPLEYTWTFGDGASEAEETAGTTIEAKHRYSAPCSPCTVTLEVKDAEGKVGTKTFHLLVEEEAKGGGGSGGGSSGGGTTTTTTTTTTPPPPPPPGNPDATLAGTSTTVSSNGAFTLKVSCPHGESSCAGSVTLRTLTAVSTAKKRGKKKAILTLATGSFSVVGGQVKSIVLHLSGKARALLARSHTLRARATLVAHDGTGATHTTTVVVTLRAAKRAHRKH